MKDKTLGKDILEYLMGIKLNNHVTPSSIVEKEKVLKMGREYIEQHPDEHIDIC